MYVNPDSDVRTIRTKITSRHVQLFVFVDEFVGTLQIYATEFPAGNYDGKHVNVFTPEFLGYR
jgi:hypothetical protein